MRSGGHGAWRAGIVEKLLKYQEQCAARGTPSIQNYFAPASAFPLFSLPLDRLRELGAALSLPAAGEWTSPQAIAELCDAFGCSRVSCLAKRLGAQRDEPDATWAAILAACPAFTQSAD